MEKVINGEVVRRSKKYPNYGSTKEGKIFRWDTEKPMKICLRGSRESVLYYAFRACHENKPKNVMVHIVVADCWVVNDNPEIKIQVNHIDGNKLNPNFKNLEWVTPSQNQRHALSTGLKGELDQLYNSSLTNDQVHLVCQRLEDGHRAKDIADTFNVSIDIIRKIKSGDTYFNIRNLYNIPHDYKNSLSESTVRWVCEKINEGRSDRWICDNSSNNFCTLDVKRIRYKIRYRIISDEYF